jgi:hypothetical protein
LLGYSGLAIVLAAVAKVGKLKIILHKFQEILT